MGEGGIVCAQIVLTIFNIIQFLFGWLFIIAGAIIKANSIAIKNTGEVGAAIFLIVIGCILVVISIIGCIGTWTKNFCLLVTFSTLTAIVFILVIIALIVAFVSRAKAPEVTENALMDMIAWNDTELFEAIQLQWKCCGVNGPVDWKLNIKYRNGSTLPPTCCQTNVGECTVNNSTLYHNGCKDSFAGILQHSLLILGSIAAACAISIFVAIFAAAYLAHSIRGSYHAV